MAAARNQPEAGPARAAPRTGAPPAQVAVPHHPQWPQRLAARLIYAGIRCLGVTIRFRVGASSNFFSALPAEKIIFATWHNRLALALIIYQRFVTGRDRQRKLAALVSASRDGGMLARTLEHFAVQPVRGSSSRRAAQGLRELVTWGERGYDLAITPDGPRGPLYTVPEGVIATAQLTGLAIVPVVYHVNWKIGLKSWDRFQIPLPFARCEISTGRMIRVSRGATAAEREELRQQLEAELRAITRD